MRQRLEWMDQVRGLAIFAVIVFHSSTVMARFLPGGEDGVPKGLTVALASLFPYRMPILMFLSGMLLQRSLDKRTRAYFIGKMRSIAWPYVVWSAIFLAVSAQLTLVTFIKVFVVSPTYLWYLQFLLYYYVAGWFLVNHKYFSRVPAWMPLLLAAIGSLGPDQYRISRCFFLFIFFWGGHLVATNQFRIKTLVVSFKSPLLDISMGALVVLVAFYSAINPLPYDLRTAIGPVALGFLLIRHATKIPISRSLTFIGKHSIVFYTTHFTIIWVVDWWLSQWTTSAWVLWSVGSIAALLVGTFISLKRDRLSVAGLFVCPRRSEPSRISPA